MFPKIGENPPNHPMLNRVFHEIHHPFWGKTPPIFGSTPISIVRSLPLLANSTQSLTANSAGVSDFPAGENNLQNYPQNSKVS